MLFLIDKKIHIFFLPLQLHNFDLLSSIASISLFYFNKEIAATKLPEKYQHYIDPSDTGLESLKQDIGFESYG